MVGDDACIEVDVLAKLEAVGNVIRVFKDFGLGRVPFGPFPLLLKLLRELVGIFETFDIATCPGVAIPKPGAANAAAGFHNFSRQALQF